MTLKEVYNRSSEYLRIGRPIIKDRGVGQTIDTQWIGWVIMKYEIKVRN